MKTTPSNSPTLQHVLDVAVGALLGQIHTALPGQIETYDQTTQLADVKPLLGRRYADGTALEFPVIPNVPVVWPRGTSGSLTFPLQRGDGVMLVFAERSLDDWLSRKMGDVSTPEDLRRFDLTDAIAVPGLYPGTAEGLAAGNADMQLIFKGKSIFIRDNGDIEIDGGNKIVVKANGDIELGGASVQKLLTESFKTNIFDLHVHPAPGGTTSAPTPIPDPLGLTTTSKVKAQ